jgi:hypothetical protein
MNTTKIIIAFGLLTAAAPAADSTTPPFDHRFILSPLHADDERKVITTDIGDYLEREAAPLTTVTVIDGLGLRVVARATVPKLAYDTPEGRAASFVDAFMGKIEDFFDEERHRKHPLRGRAALRIPEAIAEAARGATPATRIIVWGSVTYEDDVAEQLGFKEGANYTVPSPSVLKQNPAQHPFGAIDRPSLGGASVWFKIQDPFPHGDVYRHQVEGFYRLYIGALEGELIRLSADGATLMREICLPTPPAPRRIEAVPARLTEIERAPAVPSELVQQVRRQLDAAAGNAVFAVGIGWGFPADLDVHWFPNPAQPYSVCYKSRAHGPALHLGDKTVGGAGFEVIRFSAMPDVKSELWLNVFAVLGASGTPRSGVVIFRHQGREVEKRFTISATTTGNGNRNIMGREVDAENWLKLDWKAALGVP